ncbi:MAG: zf-HC2 domain-containing protein [Solibacillus sp.]
MKCDVMLLEDYIEDFLDEQQQQAVEQHLKHCHTCQQQYAQLKQEQQALMEQLNVPMLVESQAGAIMQQLNVKTKRKTHWQTIQIAVISVAVLFVSFALYYLKKTDEITEPPNPPIEAIAANDAQELDDIVPEATNNEPMLKASIDKVVENGEETEIQFRLKLNDTLQEQQNALYQTIRTRYQYKEVDYSQIDHTLDDFYGHVRTSVKFAIRDEQGNLITATKRIEGETPMLNDWSISGDNTDILGESTYTTTVPTNTKPATFEVLHMQAEFFDLYEAEIDNVARQPFEFNGYTYEIDALELTNNGLQLTLSTAGKQDEKSPSWSIVIDNHLYSFTQQKTGYNGERTVYVIVFENLNEIPDYFKLVPTTAFIEQAVEQPIVLKLR